MLPSVPHPAFPETDASSLTHSSRWHELLCSVIGDIAYIQMQWHSISELCHVEVEGEKEKTRRALSSLQTSAKAIVKQHTPDGREKNPNS